MKVYQEMSPCGVKASGPSGATIYGGRIYWNGYNYRINPKALFVERGIGQVSMYGDGVRRKGPFLEYSFPNFSTIPEAEAFFYKVTEEFLREKTLDAYDRMGSPTGKAGPYK